MEKKAYVVVVGIDFEAAGELAFDEAVRIACAHRNAEIHVLHVASDKDGTAIHDKLESVVNHRLEVVIAREPGRTFNRVVTHFRTGKAATAIVQLAVDLDADAIVVGTHNRTGLGRFVLGSVAETVVHRARCPVFVARRKDHLDLGEVPEIEPPCDACVAKRAATQGEEMWCDRHALARFRPRVHKVMRGANRRDPEPWQQATPES